MPGQLRTFAACSLNPRSPSDYSTASCSHPPAFVLARAPSCFGAQAPLLTEATAHRTTAPPSFAVAPQHRAKRSDTAHPNKSGRLPELSISRQHCFPTDHTPVPHCHRRQAPRRYACLRSRRQFMNSNRLASDLVSRAGGRAARKWPPCVWPSKHGL